MRARDEMSVRRRQSVPLTAPFLAASSGAYAAVWFGSMGGIGNVGFGRIFFSGKFGRIFDRGFGRIFAGVIE